MVYSRACSGHVAATSANESERKGDERGKQKDTRERCRRLSAADAPRIARPLKGVVRGGKPEGSKTRNS